MGDLGEGQARAFLGHESVGGRAEELVVQCPQEAFVVHEAGGEGDRLLACLLRDYYYRRQARPQRLDSLPMGRPTLPPTVAYWRNLLIGSLIHPLDYCSLKRIVRRKTSIPNAALSSFHVLPENEKDHHPVG